MHEHAQNISTNELLLINDLQNVWEVHQDSVFFSEGLPFANIADQYILTGRIKTEKRITDIVVEKHLFRNNEVVTTLSVDGQEYIIGDYGVIFAGEPDRDQKDETLKRLREIVRITSWNSYHDELLFY
jgi:hypothetical protein